MKVSVFLVENSLNNFNGHVCSFFFNFIFFKNFFQFDALLFKNVVLDGNEKW